MKICIRLLECDLILLLPSHRPSSMENTCLGPESKSSLHRFDIINYSL